METQTTNTQQAPKTTNMNRRTIGILVAIAVLIIGLLAGILLVREPQTPQKQAEEPVLSCPADGFRCLWNKEEGVTYECTINEVTESGRVQVATPQVQTDPATGKGLCTYSPQPLKTYECVVRAILEPGCESTATGQMTCPVEDTPTPTVTPSMTPTPTANPACYDRTCTEPNDTTSCADLPQHTCVDTDPTSGSDYRCVLNPDCTDAPEGDPKSCWCYAPTPTPTATPTPTITPSVTLTPTATPTGTLTPTATPTATKTPTPTATPRPGQPTNTPAPTDIVVVVNVTSTPAPTNVVQSSPMPSSQPTLPVAGGLSYITTAFIIVGIIAIGFAFAL